MVNRDYATRVLFALSFGNFTGYALSKYIATGRVRVSNGTLVPVLNHLLSEGFIIRTESEKRKVYRLTEKGELYVKEVRLLRNELKRRILVDSVNENALFFDFLSNLDDAKILRNLLEYLGDDLMSIVIKGFILLKGEKKEKLDLLKSRLSDMEKEVQSWLSQEVQN